MDINEIGINPLGDAALVISFDQKIDLKINSEVVKLTQYLKSREIEGILYYIPAYCSITIGYDPGKWNFSDLSERIYRFIEKLIDYSPIYHVGSKWKIPVCYDSKYAFDLESLSKEKKVSPSQIIDWHVSKIYSVYMLGFLPGFVYLGDLPKELHCHRKAQPRTKVPAQSVAIAGAQTGIYPLEAPGGWQIIGKSPVPIFSPMADPPFLFKAGDQVQFYPVDKRMFSALISYEYHELKNYCLVNE